MNDDNPAFNLLCLRIQKKKKNSPLFELGNSAEFSRTDF